jgi:D,D-heptose 1,7-bisphosphate phosphatase
MTDPENRYRLIGVRAGGRASPAKMTRASRVGRPIGPVGPCGEGLSARIGCRSEGLANQCVILLGGLSAPDGAGAKPTPNPLVDIGGAPFVETLVAEARRRGFRDFLLLAGHRGDAVTAFLSERSIEARFNCSVQVSVEPVPASASGALVHASPRLQDDFLLLDGERWFDFNWLDLFAKSRRDAAAATAALREIIGPLEGSRVSAIPLGDGGRALIDGGVYYLTRRAVEGFPALAPLEADILPELVRRVDLRGYPYSGFFIDIGIPDHFAAAADLVPRRRRRRAVFLDRDGVLNIDRGYVHAPKQVEWFQGAKEAVKLRNDAGYYVFVVTNQAGVAKGYYEEDAVGALHRWMSDELAIIGASIDDWRYCPLHPEGSVVAYRAAHDWRKPSPGMILDLIAHWPIEREESALIGDKASDIQAAEAAGVASYLFEGGDLMDFVRARTLGR